jgi:Tfp pilus assembly protein PilX
MNKIHIKQDKGFVIVIVLIAILAMTFFLLTGITTTASTMKVSGNYARTIGVFNIAETGLAKARPLLENQSFTTILSSHPSGVLIPDTSFGNGVYNVTVADDENDNDGNPLVDSNNIIKVTSTATNTQGARVQIETHLQLILGDIQYPPKPSTGCSTPPCDSAALFCGTDTDVKTNGSGWNIDGADYPVPPDSCTGSACRTLPNPATSGNEDLISEGNLNLTGGAGVTYSQDITDSNSGCSQWQTFYNQWASISPTAPGVVVINGSTFSGHYDCTQPKVFLINTVGTLTLDGNTFLCGMFILGTDTSLNMNGTITLVGTILAMGSNSALSYTGTTGTSNIYGKVIFKTTTIDTQKEMYLKGNAGVQFSSAGMNYGLQAVNSANNGGGPSGLGTLITSAWKENY